MEYTIQKLASLAGISVRTLHYYDEIGLLKPARIEKNGYRKYGEEEQIKLQQILFFRELEFPLEQIKEMFESPNFNRIEALRDQKKLVMMKKSRLENLLKTIDKTINSMEKNKPLSEYDRYGALSDDQVESYKEEVRQKYGEKAFRESQERYGKLTEADKKRIGDRGIAITQAVADNMDKGIKSKEVQSAIKDWHDHIHNFYDCSLEIFRGLGNLYVDDKRFTAYYEKVKPGLAQFMHEAMDYYCDKKEGKIK